MQPPAHGQAPWSGCAPWSGGDIRIEQAVPGSGGVERGSLPSGPGPGGNHFELRNIAACPGRRAGNTSTRVERLLSARSGASRARARAPLAPCMGLSTPLGRLLRARSGTARARAGARGRRSGAARAAAAQESQRRLLHGSMCACACECACACACGAASEERRDRANGKRACVLALAPSLASAALVCDDARARARAHGLCRHSGAPPPGAHARRRSVGCLRLRAAGPVCIWSSAFVLAPAPCAGMCVCVCAFAARRRRRPEPRLRDRGRAPGERREEARRDRGEGDEEVGARIGGWAALP